MLDHLVHLRCFGVSITEKLVAELSGLRIFALLCPRLRRSLGRPSFACARALWTWAFPRRITCFNMALRC